MNYNLKYKSLLRSWRLTPDTIKQSYLQFLQILWLQKFPELLSYQQIVTFRLWKANMLSEACRKFIYSLLKPIAANKCAYINIPRVKKVCICLTHLYWCPYYITKCKIYIEGAKFVLFCKSIGYVVTYFLVNYLYDVFSVIYIFIQKYKCSLLSFVYFHSEVLKIKVVNFLHLLQSQ